MVFAREVNEKDIANEKLLIEIQNQIRFEVRNGLHGALVLLSAEINTLNELQLLKWKP